MKIYSIKKLIKAKNIKEAIRKSYKGSETDMMEVTLEYDDKKEDKKGDYKRNAIGF